MSSAYAVGPQGGRSLSSPTYQIYKYTRTYTPTTLINGEFPRVTGQQRISIILTYGGFDYTFCFSISGGTNQQVTNCLPMFPNTAPTYDQSINYVPDGKDIAPVGCTVEMHPVPIDKSVSRINIFNVTESTTGSNYVFQLSVCPFFNIPTIINSIGPALDSDTIITVTVEFFRVNPDLRTNGVFISRMTPSYRTVAFIADIEPVDSVNPLDSGDSVPFVRFNGQQTIIVTNETTGFYFMLDVDYGIVGQGNGYLGYLDPSENCKSVYKSVNCTLESVFTSFGDSYSITKTMRLRITTSSADDGGHVYEMSFSPYAYTKLSPTIKLVSGNAIGDSIVSVQVNGRYFDYV